jgi:uncharacterized protein (DUF2225 family)
MHRECFQCHRPFTAQDLVKEESKGMEVDRQALGLEGVRFLYYACPACGYADIFVDIRRLEDETAEAFQQRRAALEAVVRQVQGDKTAVGITVRGASATGPPG